MHVFIVLALLALGLGHVEIERALPKLLPQSWKHDIIQDVLGCQSIKDALHLIESPEFNNQKVWPKPFCPYSALFSVFIVLPQQTAESSPPLYSMCRVYFGKLKAKKQKNIKSPYKCSCISASWCFMCTYQKSLTNTILLAIQEQSVYFNYIKFHNCKYGSLFSDLYKANRPSILSKTVIEGNLPESFT